jgi:hypothetical protein
VKRKIPSNAFDLYVAQGTGRSYDRLAGHLGVSKRAVTSRATKERWMERLVEIERKASQEAAKKAVESLEAMNERHLKSIRVVQGRALEALRSMPLTTAMEAVRALDMAIRHERVIRGEPSDRTAVSVEDVIKREYERWMTPKETSSA